MNFKDAEKLNSKKLCDVTFGKGKRKNMQSFGHSYGELPL